MFSINDEKIDLLFSQLLNMSKKISFITVYMIQKFGFEQHKKFKK